MQIFAEGQRHDREGVLVVGAHADPLRALVGQRPHVDVGAKRIAAHQLDGDRAEFCSRGADLDAQDAAVLLPALVVLMRTQDEQFLLGSSQCARMPSKTPVP